jgi:hypothetical protein
MFKVTGRAAGGKSLVVMMDWSLVAFLTGGIRYAVPHTLVALATLVIKQAVRIGQLSGGESRPIFPADQEEHAGQDNTRTEDGQASLCHQS